MPARKLGDPVQAQLFDLSKDPAEKENLAEHEPELMAKMIADYDEWFEEIMADLKQAGGPPPVTPPCP
jgi:cob(I)alamin adenosyltransferase